MCGRWSVTLSYAVFAVLAVLVNSMPPTHHFFEGESLDEEVQYEIEVMKQRILSELGMSRVPDVSQSNVSADHMNVMLGLYERSVRESERQEMESDLDKTLLRFYSHTDSELLKLKLSNAAKNSTSQRLYFALHTSPRLRRAFTVHSAKLQIPGTAGGKEPKVYIYKRGNSEKGRIIVTSQSVDPDRLYISEVDITETVRSWIRNPRRNFGLLVECHGCATYAESFKRNLTSIHEPAVLDVVVTQLPSRSRRSNPTGPNPSNITFLDCTRGLRTKMCCRRSLKMSFKEIGWDWIVQPVEFESFFCKGRCHYKSNSLASTHAFVQSLLHSKGHKVPKPCCAPKKLRALNMLHYNDNDPPQLVVTKQKGMIVKDCACL